MVFSREICALIQALSSGATMGPRAVAIPVNESCSSRWLSSSTSVRGGRAPRAAAAGGRPYSSAPRLLISSWS
eukprot:9208232-Pyramimonas_sp.AAC.1